jgi:hypothetical protein
MPINYQYKNLIDNSKLYLNETKQSKIDLINDHAVWKTENLIGYTKINSIKDKNYMIGNAY